MIAHQDTTVTVHHGDALGVLRGLPDASVDAVVTDPPYSLSFMSKAWDAHESPLAFQQWCGRWGGECLRVLKPGGHMLAFGGTRTWHRLACAVEDAGFEVRDSIAWLYGSGFPKSLDVSKAIDKAAGAEVETRPRFNTAGDVGAGNARDGYAAHAQHAPATDDARTWQGWGTALKPAFEPIVVARKPLGAGTVAANVLRHGTGALNIDACRIGRQDGDRTDYGLSNGAAAGIGYHGLDGRTPYDGSAGRWPANVILDESQAAELDAMSGESASKSGGRTTNALGAMNDDGWQAKDLPRTGHDDTGGASRFFYTAREDAPRWMGAECFMCNGTGEDFTYSGEPMQPTRRDIPTGLRCRACNGHGREPSEPLPIDDLGARFTYTAKAATDERVRVDGVSHPTVKPLSLMRWLVRLVTPPGGVVLEPFAGSGTTVEACILEGFRCIAIEREGEYLPLIMQRVHRRRNPVEAVKATGDDAGLFDLIEEEPA